jgi:hypothetical protein
VQRGVLVLVDGVHGRAGLEEDLGALQLAVAAGEVEASPSFRVLLVLVDALLQGFLQALLFLVSVKRRTIEQLPLPMERSAVRRQTSTSPMLAVWWMMDSSSYSPSSSPAASSSASLDGPTPIARPNCCRASGSFQYLEGIQRGCSISLSVHT